MKKTLAIIIPCYNEFFRFPKAKFIDLINSHPGNELCFVNDGSSDRTQEILENLMSLAPSRVFTIKLPKNRGKGEAVRAGINYMLSESTVDFVCYLDADLSTPFSEVDRVLPFILEGNGLQCIFGSRISVFGTEINRFKYRHYGGRVISTIIDLVLNLKIYDTQCGLKIFKAELASRIFEDPFITRWLFDVEIFARIKSIYPLPHLKSVMREIPLIEWTERGSSKVRAMDIFKIPLQLLKIRNRYKQHKNVSYQISKNPLPSNIGS